MKLSNIQVKKQFILFIFLFTFAGTVSAHPGNTAADGCHYCRTNCDKWGVPWDERHCHGGESAPAAVYEAPTNTPIPLPTWTPWPTSTPIPTKTPTPSITLTPTITLTPSITQTPTPTKKLIVTPSSIPEVKGQSTDGNFWGWLISLFSRL